MVNPHVVILGGGFGGLDAARALAQAPVRITLIDRHNYHLFQPLLYQVATASLSPADVASPIRWVLRKQKNVEVLLAEARSIDPAARSVTLDRGSIDFDYLIVATGAAHSYFGHDEWAARAPGLKTLDDALRMRQRILLAFESAERATDADEQRRLLTFVIIGGGPTGVELAGALAEIARQSLRTDFRRIRPESARILLIEGSLHLLGAFRDPLREDARRALERLGVEVLTDARVVGVDDRGVTFVRGPERAAPQQAPAGPQQAPAGPQQAPAGVQQAPAAPQQARAGVQQASAAPRQAPAGPQQAPAAPPAAPQAAADRGAGLSGPRTEHIDAQTILWAAGVAASPLARSLGVPLDRAGRVAAEPTLLVPGQSRIFVVGDICAFTEKGTPLPGVAQVAMQQGTHAARNIVNAIAGRPLEPFKYRDYGVMATIGRGSAVGDLFGLRISGFFAWLFWIFLHIFWLIGFRNRIAVMSEWAWAYLTFQRRVRLITDEKLWPSPTDGT